MIRITSKHEGFRRAGIAHSIQPKDYPDEKFSEEQLAALKSEPMLLVKEIPDEGGEDIGKLTVSQLTEEILKINPEADLKNMKKADLVATLQSLKSE